MRPSSGLIFLASLFLAWAAACHLYSPPLYGQLPNAQLPQVAIDPQPQSILLQLIERLARRHSLRRQEDEHFPRGFTHFLIGAGKEEMGDLKAAAEVKLDYLIPKVPEKEVRAPNAIFEYVVSDSRAGCVVTTCSGRGS